MVSRWDGAFLQIFSQGVQMLLKTGPAVKQNGDGQTLEAVRKQPTCHLESNAQSIQDGNVLDNNIKIMKRTRLHFDILMCPSI